MMKVIGVGMPKTGTRSLCMALNRLGIRCLHHPNDQQLLKLYEGNNLGYEAVVEFGVDQQGPRKQSRWRAMVDAFRDAKVILTTRNKESWLNSMLTHVLINRLTDRANWKVAETPAWSKRFDQHHAAVESRFGDQILQLRIMEEDDPWQSLCDFLGRPIPDEPFPHQGDSAKQLRLVADTMEQQRIPKGGAR